uniref:Septin-type G domain-containing protein n=1 Tax=Oreochromis niloticus TaxID=8128 RepID=A0A669D361_ORENI
IYPNKVYRKPVKRGFQFTLMDCPGPSHRIKKTVQVEYSKVLIKEGGVQLSLTIVDTPGLGDVLIFFAFPQLKHILEPHAMWLTTASAGINYIEFMKILHDKVNVIPLIAKADTLTPEECHLFKKQIMKEIQEHKIKIYEFPDVDKDDDNKLVQKIKEKMPLAVVGSNVVIEVNSKKVRGRQYPWGVAEVENGEHCDFCRYTNSFFYCSKDLTGVSVSLSLCNGVDTSKTKGQLTKSPLAQMEEERKENVMKIKKMEAESEVVFEIPSRKYNKAKLRENLNRNWETMTLTVTLYYEATL